MVKKFFIRDNKGFTIVEMVIVLVITALFAIGFMGSFGDRDRLKDGWQIESTAIARNIIAKQKMFAAKNLGSYTDDIPKTGLCILEGFVMDTRTKKYFREFSVEIKNESAADAFGNNKNLDILYINLYGSGSASGVVRTARYNRFADTLTWTDGSI